MPNTSTDTLIERMMKEFNALCIVNKTGDCKYWNPEAFGYAPRDSEAPLDKFFPEKVKDLFRHSISSIKQSAYEEGYEAGKLAELEASIPGEIKVFKATRENIRKEAISTYKKELAEKIEKVIDGMIIDCEPPGPEAPDDPMLAADQAFNQALKMAKREALSLINPLPSKEESLPDNQKR